MLQYRCVQLGSRLGLTSVTSVTCSVTIQVIGSKWSRGEGRVFQVYRELHRVDITLLLAGCEGE